MGLRRRDRHRDALLLPERIVSDRLTAGHRWGQVRRLRGDVLRARLDLRDHPEIGNRRVPLLIWVRQDHHRVAIGHLLHSGAGVSRDRTGSVVAAGWACRSLTWGDHRRFRRLGCA